MTWIECVPNFSAGLDPAVGRAIRTALESAPGARLLDWHADPDHNRSVATLVGEPHALEEAAFAGIARAAELIDLNHHAGVHPRIGACDVCPFVPLTPADMPACIQAAHALGARVGAELAIPVFFYGAAALRPERADLPQVRGAGFEALRQSPAGELAPDRGPARVHPTAGAIAIGARAFLIAFNVNLETRDLEVARAIAGTIRERNGGLPGIRALGFPLTSQGCVQVSVNVTAPERTSLMALFVAIEERARGFGVSIRGSELVGLAPRFALDEGIARRVRLKGFEGRRHVLEDALEAARAVPERPLTKQKGPAAG